MKKYDVEKFIKSIEENPNVDKLKDIKVGTSSYLFNDKRYYLKYNSKKYPFRSFTKMFELQEYDKKNLKNIKSSYEHSLVRFLKLTCSLNLADPKLVLASTLNHKLTSFITYQENGIEKLIDYAKNMVMNKDDYYELFEVKEINVLDKVDLYKIYTLLEKYDDHQNVLEYLLFTKEKFEDLSYQNPILKNKYDQDGMHYGNYTLIGNNHDCIFFLERDLGTQKYNNIIERLGIFTADPSKDSKYFKYLEDKRKYKYQDFKTNFTFDLLSNYAKDEKQKNKLLSFDRYGYCYADSYRTSIGLIHAGYDNMYIVGGKIKCNEVDYFHHCWLEYEKENKTFVIDYVNNLIVEKSIYYKINEAVMINKTKAQDMEKIKKIVEPVFDPEFSPLLFTFFGEEMLADFKKNEKVLLKK